MEDKLRQESQQTLSDDIVDIGKTAAAIGIGAAVFYRGVGGRRLSKFIDRYAKKVSTISKEIDSYAYQDLNKDSLKKIWDDAKGVLQQPETEDLLTYDLETFGNENSMLAAIHKGLTFLKQANNPEYLGEKPDFNHHVMQPILKHVRETMTKSQHKFRQGVIDEAVSFSKKIMDEYSKEKNGLKSETDINIAVSRFKKAVGGHVQEDVFNALVSDIKNNITKRTEEFNERVNGTLRTKNENFFAKTLLSVEGLKRYESKSDNFLDKILGDSRATIADILRTRRQARGLRTIYDPKDKKGAPYADALEELNKYVQSIEYEKERMAFLNLKVSPSVRVDNNGNVYSLKSLTQTKNSVFQFAANTLPGKILKLQDVINRNAGSAFRHIKEGEYNPVLAAVEAKRMGKESNGMVQQDYWVLNGKFYEQTSPGDFKRIAELDNAVIYDGRFGGVKNLITSMGGLNAERERGTIATFLDLNGQVENNVFESALSIVKREGKEKTSEAIVKRIANPLDRAATDAEQLLVDRYEDVRELFKLIQNNSFELPEEAVRKLQEIDPTDELLNLLKSNDVEDIAFGLSEHISNQGTIANKGLLDFVSNFERNPVEALNEIVLKNDPSGAYYSGAANSQNALQVLKTEIAKEYFVRHANEATGATAERLDSIMNIIETAGLSPTAEKQTKRLAYGAVLDSETGFVFHNEYIGGDKTKEDVSHAISIVEDVLGDVSTAGANDARITVENLAKDDTSVLDSPHIQKLGEVKKKPLSDAIVINKTYSPLDLIRDINQSISEAGSGTPLDYTKKFFGQFIAGRKNMEDVTESTLFPYFFLHRLGPDLEPAGLGFSNKSTGSIVDLAKTIGLKRILPVVAGGTMLEWGDDTFGAITGTRASATMVNGFANLDLFARKVMDATGIHGFIDSQMDFAPMQYWGGKDGFYSYDQEKDYYENGYEEVRKGRYWAFGSANEFRGGQIQYYQPNLTRRLNSDYYNKSLYDGYWDKWNHSLLPTPANPLSPLIYALDPYYLENEHKYDRPYPVSGPMFSEGTPWGVVLNPTIGEFIKPRIRLNEDRLQDGADVLAIIADINNKVRQKNMDRDRENIITLDNGKLTPSVYRAYDHPTPNESVIHGAHSSTITEEGFNPDDTFGRTRAGVNMQEYVEALDNASGSIIDAIPSSGSGGSGGSSNQGSDAKAFLDEQVVKGSDVAAMVLNIAESFSSAVSAKENQLQKDSASAAIDVIANANNQIRKKAKSDNNGIIVGDKLSYSISPISDSILEQDDVDDLIRQGNSNDTIGDAADSFRLIAGIYGYGANRLFGLGDDRGKHIANSGDIDSFSRSFWDAGIGGIGGGVSEIGRRFIPEFRRRNIVNPLLNTMPDWLPERFRTGDPYTKIPMGEARLPGEGYEALNRLHSDEYGIYGAFDRYKILADVAPNSQELKIWRKIAKETVKDPQLKREMDDIQDRMNEQNKVHDFYSYRFLGNNVDRQSAVITKVMDDGLFTVAGSSEVYKLAGVDFDKYANNSKQLLSEHLQPGMTVTLAIDSNEYHQKDSKNAVNAAVYIDGESVSLDLYDEGQVKRRKGSLNAADTYAMHGSLGILEGSILEFAAHTKLPLLSSRWLRVQSPLESYKDEQIFGTPYQTWSDVIGTTLLPAWYYGISDPWDTVRGAIEFNIINKAQSSAVGKTKRRILSGIASMSNMGSFMGGAIAYFIKPNEGRIFAKGQKIGAAATFLGTMYSSSQGSTLGAMSSWGLAGYYIGDLLDKDKSVKNTRDILKKVAENNEGDVKKAARLFYRSAESFKLRGKATAIGAALGLLSRSFFGPSIFSDEDHWIPEKTKRKWEIEEYFDRLTYIKYMGLYEKAAQKAKEEEGVEVKKVIEKMDEANDEVKTIKDYLADLMRKAQSHNMTNEAENKTIVNSQNKLDKMRSTQMVLKGGEFTRSALLYKQAAEATMYGLKDNAEWTDIIKALPRYERDYFSEFMKEKDPEKQKEILKEASPFLRRALKQVWKMDYDKPEDNSEYFQNHNLPGVFWEGWSPDVNLNDVKAKVIKNEAMAPGDFGIYESQYRDQNVINAPNISPKGSQDPVSLKLQLESILNGMGLSGAEVSVEPSNASGIQGVINIERVAEYKLGQMINDVFSF